MTWIFVCTFAGTPRVVLADEIQTFESDASPSPFSINGRVYTDQYFLISKTSQSSSLEQSSLSTWLDLNYHRNAYAAHAVEQLDFFAQDLNHPSAASMHSNLREAYASYSTPGHQLKLGQQIIPWGKSDGVNPTDYFTAKNYTLLNPDDEVRRIGAPALHYDFTPEDGNSPFNFEAVIQAYYPQMKLIIPDQAIPSGITLQRYPNDPSAFQSDSMEFGIKIAYLKSDYDFSISAFRGFSQYPEYIFNPKTLSVAPINPKETAFGGDASFNWGTYIIRLESALHLPENGSRSDPLFGLVEPNHLDTVIGLERPFFTNFRLQAQFLYRLHLDYQDPSSITLSNPLLTQIGQAVGKANALILNYQQKNNPGATIRISYAKDNSNWSGDLFLLGYFGGGQDFLLRRQLGYTPTQNLKLQIGFDLYGGNESRPLGALHNRSDAFFEGRYLF